MKNRTPKKRRWTNYSCILLLIGSIIGLLSLIAPAGSFHYGNLYSWDMWMFGYNIIYDWEVGTEIFWTVNRYLFLFSLVSTIFVVIGNFLSIFAAVKVKRKSDYAHITAGISSIILTGFTLFYLISYELYFVFNAGESFWSLLNPSFAVYGQFIAAAFMVPAFFIARKASLYSEPLEKEVHQEKVYNMLKTIIETKRFSESGKNKLKKDLEVISLRFKGYTFLQEKMAFTSMENRDYEHLEDGLKYFQQAFDLSSSSQQKISKEDLYLVEQIIKEEDKLKAMNYLNEISDHTTILLGEILKILT
ncbi:MAG: hypothetical protein WBH31_13525 [Promethearchaeia archaeon]